MYIDEIRALSTDEILDKIEDLKVEMYTYRLQKESGELKDTTLFRRTRRDIARLKTALRERELAAALIAEGDSNNVQ
jgi:large subunit ribosomal protein L29